jgi:predicted ATP-grasp superfamily ATP-dependent carboligase
VPHPPIRLTPPDHGEDWLIKSIGGSGGIHVRRCVGTRAGRGDYFQRVASGRPIGISFLADGRRAAVIGFNEQWHDGSDPAQPFRFGGLLQPAAIGERLGRDVRSLLDAVVTEFGLVGLNNIDVMDDGDSYAVLEINPRPGANLDVFDHDDGIGLFSSHILACEGQLPDAFHSPPVAAMAVVYAGGPSTVAIDTDWLEWVADRPAEGICIEHGAPVCTVLANGETAADVRRLLAARVSLVKSRFLATSSRSDCDSQPAMAEAAHA